MYILLILFFIALLGIGILIGRKLLLLRNGEVMIIESEYAHPFVPDLEKIKEATAKHTKKFGYVALVATIRVYLRSANLIKSTSKNIKDKIKNLINKIINKNTGKMPEKREVSKFLKMVSDYKYKIRNIKHRIHEEEGMK